MPPFTFSWRRRRKTAGSVLISNHSAAVPPRKGNGSRTGDQRRTNLVLDCHLPDNRKKMEIWTPQKTKQARAKQQSPKLKPGGRLFRGNHLRWTVPTQSQQSWTGADCHHREVKQQGEDLEKEKKCVELNYSTKNTPRQTKEEVRPSTKSEYTNPTVPELSAEALLQEFDFL